MALQPDSLSVSLKSSSPPVVPENVFSRSTSGRRFPKLAERAVYLFENISLRVDHKLNWGTLSEWG